MLTRVNHSDENELWWIFPDDLQSTERVFVQANTIPVTLNEIRSNHIIPVFMKDNETAISQGDFIETVMAVASQSYYGERILKPSIRVSHPIKGPCNVYRTRRTNL